jgi:hypothetical protein
MPLDLLLCSDMDLPDHLIALVEQSPTVHVAVTDRSGWAIEENVHGLWGRPVEQYDKRWMHVWALPLTDAQAQAAWAYLRSRIGIGYDYVEDADDAARLILPGHPEFGLHLPGRYNCSGVIAEACSLVGYRPFAPRNPRDVTPADWATLTGAHGGN